MRIAGILALAALAAAALSGCGAEQKAAACRHDEEIDKVLRDGATAAARAFLEAMLRGETTVYDDLSAAAKTKVARAQFDAITKSVLAAGPYTGLRLEHTYHPAPDAGAARAPCGEMGAMKEVSLEVLPDATQIYALFAAATRNNDWALTAWLTEEDGAWRMHGFNVAVSSIVGFDAAELFALAEAQTKKGNAFSAQMLYVAAKATVGRGSHLEFGLARDIEAALARHPPPDELEGKPPFTWRFAGATFTLEQVNLVGIDKRLGLVFLHRDPAWDGEDTGKAERRNKRLIDAFVKAHPEYKETFAFLVARILAPGKDSGWGTVYDAAKGYDTGEPSVVKKPK